MTARLNTCACLKGPSIRLSVRKASTKNRSTEYSMPYSRKTCPSNLRLLSMQVRTKNNSRHQMDSYRNVGWTDCPFTMIAHGRSVSPPCASALIKFPHLPIDCASATVGA